MAQAAFNPTHEITFDLGRGHISLGEGARILVPADALANLVRGLGTDVLIDFGRRLGAEIGRRVASRLANGAESSSPADVVEHLGGDLALVGLGSLTLERWGRALVLRVAGCPLAADGDGLLGAVLEGALQRGFGRDATVVPLERSDGAVRLLVTSAKAAASAKSWLADGVGWSEVLGRLHGE